MFVDEAKVLEFAHAGGASGPLESDLGVGLALVFPGAAGAIRLAAAHGLADGASAVTLAWEARP